ncbi:MAG: hypothetical protein QMD94_04065 [Candidatus Omnitrophota bacterium]|nr:hypothetical protein [Candidatus Omnitrophota bacterium]
MKIRNFLSISAFITGFSLLYVYQQTEILRFAYVAQKKQAVAEDLLDRNSILRYNIEKNASLVNIGGKVSKSGEFQMPDAYCLVRSNLFAKNSEIKVDPIARQTVLSKIFSVKRQAEAQTINP